MARVSTPNGVIWRSADDENQYDQHFPTIQKEVRLVVYHLPHETISLQDSHENMAAPMEA